MSISEFIRYHREAKGLTQQQLADSIGVSPGSIKQYEKEGGSLPAIDKAAALARALEFDAGDLFLEINKPGAGLDKSKSRSKTPIGQITNPVARRVLVRKFDDLPEEDRGDNPDWWHVGQTDDAVLTSLAWRISKRGLLAPRVNEEIEVALWYLNERSYEHLLETATNYGVDLSEIPTAEQLASAAPEVLAEACNQLECYMLATTIYGEIFSELELNHINTMHVLLASLEGKSTPLPGVPTRTHYEELSSSNENSAKHALRLKISLSKYLIKACLREQPIVIFRNEAGDTSVRVAFT